MKQKRILFIEFLTITASNHLLMMIKALVKQKNCKVVLLCQKNSLIARALKKTTTFVYEVDYVDFNLHEPKTYIPFLKISLLILFIIIKHKINIIHSHRLNWAYLSVLPSIVFRIPLFIHIVIIEKLTSRFQNFLLKLHKNITYICVSKNSLKQFKKLYKVPGKNVFYHYGGLFFPDMVAAQTLKVNWLEGIAKKNKNIVAMVSRMDPLKGVDVFIEAAAILIKKFPNLQFVHIGNHPEYVFQQGYFEDCLRRVKNLRIEKKFTFVDYSEKILSFYKYFFVMALPTVKDTLSYVNLEANFNKVPVIFTDVDGLMETSDVKFNSYIPHPPSPVILAAKIEELLLNNKKYQLLKDQVFNHIAKYFDAEKNSINLIKIYETQL